MDCPETGPVHRGGEGGEVGIVGTETDNEADEERQGRVEGGFVEDVVDEGLFTEKGDDREMVDDKEDFGYESRGDKDEGEGGALEVIFTSGEGGGEVD